ncbi:MAG TPA: hypothetical protein VE967_00870 [Gemmatimonadaceae bacterium]|nr:hypothetical protein [Gemmatimonadaceae bacterium]
MKRLIPLLLIAQVAHAQPPAGAILLNRMHNAYSGKWYHTLTFVQRTIITRDGKTDTTTWYESLSGPARLRIDQGDPSLGNGVLYTADSATRVRTGTPAPARAGGNVFLPLIMGVYLQPLAETERQLLLFKFDFDKSFTTTWDGHPVTVIGASAASDSVSPQFWVDTDRLVLLRMRGSIIGPGSDVRLGGYEKVGDGWLATRVTMTTPTLKQVEEYSDWSANIDLPESLFDVKQWMTAPHWASGRKKE